MNMEHDNAKIDRKLATQKRNMEKAFRKVFGHSLTFNVVVRHGLGVVKELIKREKNAHK